MIAERLRDEIATWGHIGHPALLQRFILGTGQAWRGAPLPARVRKGAKRECFAQAIDLATRRPRALRYVEGYGLSAGLAGFPMLIHHAWCIDAKGRVVDPTWDDPAHSEYFGRPFTIAEWDEATNETHAMSALDGGFLNAAFMFRTLPGLREECEAVARAGKAGRAP